MDISLLRSRAHQFKNLFASIRIFQKNGTRSKTNPEVLSLSRGIALLLISVLIGWISKIETETNTRNQVLQNEWPPAPVWNSILNRGGWFPFKTSDLSAFLKNHPDPFSKAASIWESEDHCFIFLTQSPYLQDRSEPELWSCATGQKQTKFKLKWRKIGSGYSGINQLSQISVPIIKKTASYIDPREIRY